MGLSVTAWEGETLLDQCGTDPTSVPVLRSPLCPMLPYGCVPCASP